MNREPLPLLAFKALIAAAAACLFMYPLTTPAGFVATALGTVAGYGAARYAARRGLRIPAALMLALVLGVVARLAGNFLLEHPLGSLARGLEVADAVFCATAALAVFFAIRMLSQAWRPAGVLELGVVVGAVAHTFAGHRHHHIQEPRFLTDWALSHGIDPLSVIQSCGVAALVVAAVLLLNVRRTSKLVISLLFLIAGGWLAFWAMRDIRIDLPADTNDIPLGKGSGEVPGAHEGSGSAGSGSAGAGSANGSGSAGGSNQGSGSANGSNQGSGSASGSNSGSNQGSNSGSNQGSSSGSNQGSNSGSAGGSNSGSNQGSNSGSAGGSNSGSAGGSNSGSGGGSNSGSGGGSNSGSGGGSGTGSGGGGSGSGSGGGGGGNGGNSGQSQRPPDPVAIVVLHDDLPESDVYYFRQDVLSRFAEDRLENDTTGKYDRDIVHSFPSANAPVRGESSQVPDLHRVLSTSVYLLVDHAQPFGLGHPFEVRALENPNPRQFVAAYDVDSYFLDSDLTRLAGHSAIPPTWTQEMRDHYLAMPADPRYAELSNRIVRDMDPRFVGDDLMKALALKRYLEQKGFYSLKEKTLVGTDPTAKFLFGECRGYCVHFAHAMALLLRSQGIPSRVALGYAVQTRRHGAGSSLLILGNDAHAWPEMYLDGVGWVTIDVYPEHSDEPPPPPVDDDLESTLGEIARKDPTGGHAADPNTRLHIPWELIGGVLMAFIGGALAAAYLMKLARYLRRGSTRVVYIGVLDTLAALGLRRQLGETREKHAARVAAQAPSFPVLTRAHLREALGGNAADVKQVRELAKTTRRELRGSISIWRRIKAALDPVSWLFTR